MVYRYTIAWCWYYCGTLAQNITFYKNNTDFNIANWAKNDIKILTIKTRYTVLMMC